MTPRLRKTLATARLLLLIIAIFTLLVFCYGRWIVHSPAAVTMTLIMLAAGLFLTIGGAAMRYFERPRDGSK